MSNFPYFDADRIVKRALSEDVGLGDITTLAVVDTDKMATAELVAKEHLRLAGLDGFVMAVELLDKRDKYDWNILHEDGDDVGPGDTVLTVSGPARSLLTTERTALNLLQRLSGVATITARWSRELEGTNTKLIDTRKTTPGLRALEKYAVRVGGGANHRSGLFDGVLIKENHIRAAGSIANAIERARAFAAHTLLVEVEVTTLDELRAAVEGGADAVLLDNMDNESMAEAVRITDGRIKLEASGNMTIERLAGVAATGVDFISAGALTHSAPAVDLSLLFKV